MPVSDRPLIEGVLNVAMAPDQFCAVFMVPVKDAVAGAATVELTYDTDEGVDKMYTIGDQIGFTADMQTIFGQAVDVSGGGFLDTIVSES